MRIWFNQGFSLAPIASAMMAADPGLEVVISLGEGKPLRDTTATVWIEPNCDSAAYLSWVRHQISEHQVDVFVPTRRRSQLAIADLSCAVHLPAPPAVLAVLDDKLEFAKAIASSDVHSLTFDVADAADFIRKIQQFDEWFPYLEPCVKPRFGVNGHGFWRLTQTTQSPLTHLINPDERVMRRDLFYAALEAHEKTDAPIPFVLMPYFPGPEVSFDVLAHQGAVLKYVARTKASDRQRLQTRHALEPAVRQLVGRFKLHGVVNIQFRRAADGTWKALEINARPAGGSIYAEALGGGLLGDWGGLLTGRLRPHEVSQPEFDVEIELSAEPRIAKPQEAGLVPFIPADDPVL